MFDDLRTLGLAVIMFALIMAPLVYFFRAVLRFSRSLEVVEHEERELPKWPAIDYGMLTVVPVPFAEGLRQAKEALREDGLGVVAEIDVSDLLAFSGIPFQSYTVLAAWDPNIMAQVLQAEKAAGLLLPAHVVVAEVEGGTVIAAVDPRRLLGIAHNPRLLPVATEARAQLQRVIDRLEIGMVPGP